MPCVENYYSCCHCDSNDPLLSVSDITNIFIALANLALLYYVFVYQKQKDRADKLERQVSSDQEINLNWFKELIIAPNIQKIYAFFEELNTTSQVLRKSGLTIAERQSVDKKIKEIFSTFNRSFIGLLFSVNVDFAESNKKILDNLQAHLITKTFEENLALTVENIFKENFENPILEAHKDVISNIHHFKGI
jgi:hypothetical protein